MSLTLVVKGGRDAAVAAAAGHGFRVEKVVEHPHRLQTVLETKDREEEEEKAREWFREVPWGTRGGFRVGDLLTYNKIHDRFIGGRLGRPRTMPVDQDGLL